jgi:hypothetical protein
MVLGERKMDVVDGGDKTLAIRFVVEGEAMADEATVLGQKPTEPLFVSKIQAVPELVSAQLDDAKKAIDALTKEVLELKTKSESAMSSMTREAEKRARLELELSGFQQKASKDKAGLVAQVQDFREQLASSKIVVRVLDNKHILKYCTDRGRANELVPCDIRVEEDWIGALIKSHDDLTVRKTEKRYGGLLEVHSRMEEKDLPPRGSCSCPVCVNRWNLNAAMSDIASRDKRIKELEEENRCHRRAMGPRPADEKVPQDSVAKPAQNGKKKK